MPADIKPLFHPEAVRPKVRQFMLPPAAISGRARVIEWANKLSAKKLKEKETELLPNFLTDVFENVLGYVGPPAAATTIRREALVQVDGKRADAGFGRFGGEVADFVAVLEGKGPNDPLDVPFAGRKRSAVEQALLYALNLKIDWYIVTNLREIRLYCKQENQFTCERFDLQKLASDPFEYARFVFLLGAERVVPADGKNHLSALLTESRVIGREVTAAFYDEYHDLRGRTFKALCQHNPGRQPAELLTLTQKLLDRVLFIAFAEKRDLLPRDSIKKAYEHADPYHPRPVWDNFRALFVWVDQGNAKQDIDEFNGELFKPDAALDTLAVPDDVCHGFKKLADYEYGNTAADDDDAAKLIDVEILGHIFEQSIADLEEMQKKLKAGTPDEAVGPSKRKREGAFYTPDFVTRYIVRETLAPVLAERFETLRQREQVAVPKKGKGATARTALDDPTAFDVDALTDKQTAALVRFWELWIAELETVRVVDPSCGSGAFLVEAFDQMFAEYRRAQQYLTGLGGGQTTIVDVQRSILTNNLFGIDLNPEAIEIAKLSCWIKTAEKQKKLTALNENIVQGNSVLGSPSPLVAWAERFPAVFAAGGFDVVIGNPPYVRQEWITDIKGELQKHYASYAGTADLYVYFYELGLKLLKPGGRIGYIVTNKWLKAGYGENLRRHYGEAAWVEQVVDFGHAKQIFPDADVFPCILVARKPTDDPPPAEARVCVIPREQLRIDDLSRQIADDGFAVPRARFGAAPWNLEPPAVVALMEKLRANGVPLRAFAGCGPVYGIKTGCNEAFLIDTETRDRLVAEDPKSADVLRKYLRGQDVDRWIPEWAGEWMIFARRGIDIDKYPAVKRHLEAFRPQLEPKPAGHEGDWEGRAGGNYKWFELQASPGDASLYERAKIVYQEIQFHPCYALDTEGMLANNKVFFIPTDSVFLLGVLNSPLMWWHNWRYLPHMKDEALSPAGFLMEAIPIPKPTDAMRFSVEQKVRELIALKGGRTAGLGAMIDWLQTEIGIEKVSNRLRDLIGLTVEELLAEIKKLLPKKKGLSAADLQRIKQEHVTTVVPLKANARRADQLEREVSDLVNEAFGLTPGEVALMWDTAPPRMPFTPPPK